MEYKAMVAFPMATGFPFSYRINVPTYINLGGEAKMQASPNFVRDNNGEIRVPKTVNISADVQLT